MTANCLTALAWYHLSHALPAVLRTTGVKRLNLGGKALTNLLKETVSYRSLDMRDEGLLMEQLKEQLCWVSQVRRSPFCWQHLFEATSFHQHVRLHAGPS